MPDARALAVALGGRWHGSYGMARCLVHDDRLPSLSIRDGTDGRVLIHCHAGCDPRNVIAALRRRGLWGGGTDLSTPRARPIIADPRPPGPEDHARIDAALRICGCRRPTAGTPVEVYLRDERGVWTGAIADTIGYAPDLPHPAGGRHPAMVAAVQAPDGIITGIHRTWLAPDGHGKAEVRPQKAMLGRCSGGAVRLSTVAETVQVAEGIETALAVLSATGVPTWAALSTSGIRALILPPTVRRVVICADGDDAGEAASQAAARRWLAEGRSVRIARPPRGTDFADFVIPADGHAKVAKPAKVASAGRAA